MSPLCCNAIDKNSCCNFIAGYFRHRRQVEQIARQLFINRGAYNEIARSKFRYSPPRIVSLLEDDDPSAF